MPGFGPAPQARRCPVTGPSGVGSPRHVSVSEFFTSTAGTGAVFRSPPDARKSEFKTPASCPIILVLKYIKSIFVVPAPFVSALRGAHFVVPAPLLQRKRPSTLASEQIDPDRPCLHPTVHPACTQWRLMLKSTRSGFAGRDSPRGRSFGTAPTSFSSLFGRVGWLDCSSMHGM